jgi:hypothetical protein
VTRCDIEELVITRLRRGSGHIWSKSADCRGVPDLSPPACPAVSSQRRVGRGSLVGSIGKDQLYNGMSTVVGLGLAQAKGLSQYQVVAIGRKQFTRPCGSSGLSSVTCPTNSRPSAQ